MTVEDEMSPSKGDLIYLGNVLLPFGYAAVLILGFHVDVRIAFFAVIFFIASLMFNALVIRGLRLSNWVHPISLFLLMIVIYMYAQSYYM